MPSLARSRDPRFMKKGVVLCARQQTVAIVSSYKG